MHHWDTVMGDNTFTSFSKNGSLIGRQKVIPVKIWDASYRQLRAWTVFCTVLLWNTYCNLATKELKDLV